MFGNKRLLRFYESELSSLYKEYNKLNNKYEETKEQLSSMKKILSKYTDKTFLLYKNNNQYFITTITMYKSVYHKICVELQSFDTLNMNEVCLSYFDIYEDFSFLLSIDLKNTDYQRQGHASKHISIIKDISKNFNCKKIKGELLMDSYIGINNLIAFYEKNGFIVNKRNMTFQINLEY